MEFSAYIVKANPDKTVSKAYAIGISVLCIIVFVFSAGYTQVAVWLSGALVLAAIIFLELKKRKVELDIISTDKLTITSTQISFEGKVYDIKKIKYLVFFVEAYEGMILGYDEDGRPDVSKGKNNYLKFRFNKQDIRCGFFLSSQEHMQSLRPLFEALYKNKTSFIELDRYGGRTHLMQVLSYEEEDAFKVRYGFK